MPRTSVFISYSRRDKRWLDQIKEFLAPVVRDRVDQWDDTRTPPGARWFEEIQRALDSASVAVLLVSQHFLSSKFIVEEELPKLLEAGSRGELTIIWVPVSPSSYEYSPIAELQAVIDPNKPLALLSAGRRELALVAIAAAIAQTLNLQPRAAASKEKAVLLYKRWSDLDEEVVQFLDSELRKRGMTVFIDRAVPAGTTWGKQLAGEISNADVVIPLISDASVNSEMLAREVGIAFEASRRNGGAPRILPIRLGYRGRLPKALEILNPIQHLEWESIEEGERKIEQLWRAIRTAAASSTEKQIDAPSEEETYVERECDGELDNAIRQRERLIIIRGARQIGSTSLIARSLRKAKQSGAKVLYTDFQAFNHDQLASVDQMYRALAEWADETLDLNTDFGQVWRNGSAPNWNFGRYLRRNVLPHCERLVWALDEVDRLFSYPWVEEFFRFLRSWYNNHALSSEPHRLTFLIASGNERYQFITELNESPFNVGVSIQMRDFRVEEIGELAYRSGVIGTKEELARFYEMFEGVPYVSRIALAELRKTSLDELLASACNDNGPFGDHLRGMLAIVVNSDRMNAVRSVLQGEISILPKDFVLLRRSGILAGDSNSTVRFRCRLYREYFSRHLQSTSATAGKEV
jgi:hypothetical protein